MINQKTFPIVKKGCKMNQKTFPLMKKGSIKIKKASVKNQTRPENIC